MALLCNKYFIFSSASRSYNFVYKKDRNNALFESSDGKCQCWLCTNLLTNIVVFLGIFVSF